MGTAQLGSLGSLLSYNLRKVSHFHQALALPQSGLPTRSKTQVIGPLPVVTSSSSSILGVIVYGALTNLGVASDFMVCVAFIPTNLHLGSLQTSLNTVSSVPLTFLPSLFSVPVSILFG